MLSTVMPHVRHEDRARSPPARSSTGRGGRGCSREGHDPLAPRKDVGAGAGVRVSSCPRRCVVHDDNHSDWLCYAMLCYAMQVEAHHALLQTRFKQSKSTGCPPDVGPDGERLQASFLESM